MDYRYRSEVLSPLSVLSGNFSYNTKTWSCTALTSDTTTNSPVEYDSDYKAISMSDVVVPNFRKAVARGEIFNNPMGRYAYDYHCTPGQLTYSHRTNSYGCSPARWYTSGVAFRTGLWKPIRYDSDLFLPEPDVNLQTLQDLAVTDAYASISDTELLAYATLAESKEGLASLKSIFRRTVKILTYMRKLNLKALARELKPKELSDRWMEARYALRPLVYDAVGLTRAIYEPLAPPRQTFRGFYNTSVEDEKTTHFSIIAGGNFYHQYDAVSRVTLDIDIRAGVLTVVKDLGRLAKFGYSDLVETAWELVPASFVWDWFFNVGKVLSAWTPDFGFQKLASWVTVEKTLTQHVTSGINYSGSTDPATATRRYAIDQLMCVPAITSKETVTKMRTPDPRRYSLPHFKLRLDAFKTLDLLKIVTPLKKRPNRFNLKVDQRKNSLI